MGSITLSCSCPASAANETVISLPISLKHIWFTTSGMTGFTLAGIIDDPDCNSRIFIFVKPHLGPEESRRILLKSFEILMELRFSALDIITQSPQEEVTSVRFGALTRSMFVMPLRYLIEVSENSFGAFIPVAIEVEHKLTSSIKSLLFLRFFISSLKLVD